MKMKFLSLAIVLLFSLSGCSSLITRKPAISSVKKIAILSVYVNTDIHDIEVVKSGNQLHLLQALVTSDAKLENDAFVQLSTYGLKSFGELLSAVPGWQLIPSDQVIHNQKFQTMFMPKNTANAGDFVNALRKAAVASWATPPGMAYISVNSVTQGNHSTMILGQPDPVVVQEKLAALAKDLKVDAVAVIGLDLAYKKGWLSVTSGITLFGGILETATPKVACEMVMITKDKQVAIETPLISQGGGNPYAEGPNATMLKQGQPYLLDSKQEAMASYQIAIQKSAAMLVENVVKEMGK